MDEEFGVTESPLSAGPHAKLHLGSFALEYNFSPEYFKSIHGDFEKLEKQIDSKRKLKKLRPAADVFSLRSHEQDHLNRLIGTSFGYMLDVVRSRWVMGTVKLVEEKLKGDLDPILPLRMLPPRNGTTAEILSELASEKSIRGQHRICQGLSDCLHALLDDVPGPRLVSALWGLTAGCKDKLRYLLDDDEMQRHSGFSLFTSDGEHQALKARHLLELFAWREQGNTLLTLGYDLKDVKELFLTPSSEYKLAFDVWRHVIPQANELVAVTDDDEVFMWGTSFPFELFVCADLALWPPFEPPGRIRQGFRWYDLNPAKRYVSILMAFRDLQLPITIKRESNLNELLLDIQSKLCERLNWPTPDSLAKEWLGYLLSEQSRNETPWHELEPELSLRVAGSVTILQTRIERPADVVLNQITVEEHGGRSAPVWIFQMPTGKKKFSSLSEPFYEYVFQTLLYEGAAHLYNRDRAIILGLDEEWLGESAAKYVARKFADFGHWPDELRMRFQEICRNYFVWP